MDRPTAIDLLMSIEPASDEIMDALEMAIAALCEDEAQESGEQKGVRMTRSEEDGTEKNL